MSRRIAILARMRAILAVTVPFFALVLLGWLAARAGSCRKAPSPASMPTCSSSPCPACCFVSAPALSLDRLADPALLGIYLVSAMLMIAIAVALTLRRRRRPDHGVGLKDAAFGALVAAFPDAGFMGVPLLVARFGDPAAGPVIGVPSSSICSSRARSVWHWRRPRQRTSPAGPNAAPCTPPGSPCAAPSPTPCRGRSSSARHRRRRTSSWRHRSRRSCACSAIRQHRSPFFTIGAVLYRAGRHAHSRTPLGRYLPVALLKLFAHPALVFAIGLAARALGAPVPPFGLMVLTLTAALPSAGNVSILAEV
jgi:malonate transporter